MTNWLSRANCKDYDPDLFFLDEDERNEQAREQKEAFAKSVCKECPVSWNCLAQALDSQEIHGVWGGTTPRERHALRRIGHRATCIRCKSRIIAKTQGSEVCIVCGLSWLVNEE